MSRQAGRSRQFATTLTRGTHSSARALVGLCGMALFLSGCSREITTPAPTPPSPARFAVECPIGTVDISAATIPATGSHAFLALRDADVGSFGIWRLDLATGQWRQLLEPQFRAVQALGATATGDLLVIEGKPGDAIARIRSGGRERSVSLGRGIATSAVFDEGTKTWWVGGEFGSEGDRHVVLRIDPASVVSKAIRSPSLPWARWTANHFTGVVVRERAVLVTAPTHCDVQVFDRAGMLLRSCAIATADARLQLACTAPLPDDPSSDVIEELKVSHAWPVGLWDLGDEVIVRVRRSNRQGWALLGFDDECVLLTTNTNVPDQAGRPLRTSPDASFFLRWRESSIAMCPISRNRRTGVLHGFAHRYGYCQRDCLRDRCAPDSRAYLAGHRGRSRQHTLARCACRLLPDARCAPYGGLYRRLR